MLNATHLKFGYGSKPDERGHHQEGLLLKVKQTEPVRKRTFLLKCLLSGVLRLGKRMKFGGLGWPPR
jgi:hypothetical protein